MSDKLITITRRGVLWLGQTCNLRCHFCYFYNRINDPGHPDHPFMSLDKAKSICMGLRQHYRNTAVDIQGGEPTIYPDILSLVKHCRQIGLAPTLITNALALHSRTKCLELKDAGVEDLLISVHGLNEVYDTAVGNIPGASRKQIQAINNCRDMAIPFRFNTVLAKSVLPQLVEIVRLALESGAQVVNFIAFNPFEDQQGNVRSKSDVPMYTEVVGPLCSALDLCRKAGLEANVRYLPFCVAPEQYREHFYNFQQLPYDQHEWDYASWSWTAQNPQRRRDGDLIPFTSLRKANKQSAMFKNVENYLTDFSITLADEYRHSAWIRAREHCSYQYAEVCTGCALKTICDGFHGDYASMFGSQEATAVEGEPVKEPCWYLRGASKGLPG
ncbi:MAG: radical SAM protein [Planctomycetes bacterium]|nr:radical SAM protein [Planctomycetota bacterium]